jgi:predicted ATPase/class 3 adenylate cyclase
MPELPDGIVTFLFTDIEGSTRLWEHDPDLMWKALARHNAILGDAIATNRGAHFKTIGDAYQAAFADPVDAVRACVDAQLDLAMEPWEETGPLRVRMALHAGPATPLNGDYLAPCLNRLSRMMSTGYGGQVLVSEAVRNHIRDRLPDGVTMRELGRHRLRDLLEPEQIAQIVIEGIPDHFPPLKSLERHPTNLPIQPNPLVGREHELERITELLGEGETRLLTVTGVGGTGKTRLALQAGAELLDAFPDGVFFVDLAPVTSAALVLPTIAATLGVRESGGLTLTDALDGYLNGKRILLLLDNFEQVLDAAPNIAGLLERCDTVRILITSRGRINIRAEQEMVLHPLDTPDEGQSLDEIASSDAVALFVQRASAALPGFTLDKGNANTVAHICSRLDGLPLAIELAAARVRTLPLDMLKERLDHRLELLTGGAQDLPARQRTLRATITWSHDLLSTATQAFFDRLAVFSGGFDLESAQHVAGEARADALDTLSMLADRSLIRRVEGTTGTARFTMLETLREFGLGELTRAGTEAATRQAHAQWFLQLAETAHTHFNGPDQTMWFDRLELEHDNFRAALGWTRGLASQDQHRRLIAAIGRFWLVRGYFSEGLRWSAEVLDAIGPTPETETEIQILNNTGNLTFAHGEFAKARKIYQTAFAGAESVGNTRLQAALQNNLGNVSMRMIDLAKAEEHYERALILAEELGDSVMRANVLGNLGSLAHSRGDIDGALARYTECLTIWRQLGNTQGEVPMLLNIQLLLAPHPEHTARARMFGERCLETSRRLGDRWNEALALMGMAEIEDAHEHLDAALDLYTKSLTILRELGTQEWIRSLLGYVAVVLIDQGEIDRGVEMLLEKLTSDTEGDALEVTLEEFAVALLRRKQYRTAALAIGAAQQIRAKLNFLVQPQCKRRHDRSVAQLRDIFGAELDVLFQEGANRPIDEVVADVRRGVMPESPPVTFIERHFANLDALFAEPPPAP